MNVVDTCLFCNTEFIVHIFRDYSITMNVWNVVSIPADMINSFVLPLDNWIFLKFSPTQENGRHQRKLELERRCFGGNRGGCIGNLAKRNLEGQMGGIWHFGRHDYGAHILHGDQTSHQFVQWKSFLIYSCSSFV